MLKEYKGQRTELRTYQATIKSFEDRTLEVLGAPFGGHLDGKDTDEQFFSPKTDFMVQVGDTRPVIYYHGKSPKGVNMLKPEVIGVATVSRIDGAGVWFDVKLGLSLLADRVLTAAAEGLAKASSGAINYLIRVAEKTGEILTWPLAELSLFDTGPGRQPANQLASVALKAMYNDAGIDMPKAFTQTGEVEAKASADDTSSDDTNKQTRKTIYIVKR